MRRNGARPTDEGASLVLVLVFVLVLSVVLGAIASFSSASLRSTVALRDVRNENNALDAALNAAIQQARYDPTQGVAPGFTNGVNACRDFVAPSVTGIGPVSVSCGGEQNVNGEPDSGATEPTNNPFNKPSEALFATARAPEGGILLDANGSFRVHGGVYSTSDLIVNNATLKVEGDIIANGACSGSGSIVSLAPPYPPAGNGTPQALQCNSAATLTPEVYPAAVSSPPPTQPVPSCPSNGYLVTFNPGTYTNAAQLSALTSGSCTGKILWFKPGAYVFDFKNSGSHAWSVADATSNIIGGTPFGWSPTAPSRPVIPQADQSKPYVHSCVTDIDAVPPGADPANLGVQFIFTGDSRWAITPTGGNVELCSQPSTGAQQIALYGVPKVPGNESMKSLTATGAGSIVTFPSTVNPNGLTIGDGLTSQASIASNATTRTASVNLTGFNQLTSAELPANAVITKVTMSVAHLEGPSNGAISAVTATVTGADGAAGNPIPVTPCFTTISACTQNIDVTRYLSTVAKLRNATGGGPNVTLAMTAANNKLATETLDGIRLDVQWVPSALTASSITASGSAPFTTLNNALTADDGLIATAALSSKATANAVMGGYNQLDFTGLPPGANITKVMAKIVHTETSSQTKLTLSGTTAQGTAFTGQAVPACTAGLMECTTYVDLTSALGSEAKLRSITAGITKGPTLTFGASQPNNTSGSVSLDGVQLIVVYQPGGLGSSSGCINVTPYAANDASTCALLLAQGNKAYISIHGTVYAPGGAFDLKVMNGGTTVFGRGAIIRTLKLFFNPSVTYSGDNITVMNPDENGGRRLPRIVDFWACLPDDAGNPVLPCTDANAEVHTVVKFTDTTNGDGSVSAGTSMTVRSWAHRRS